MGIGGGNHQRTQPPQFLLQKPCSSIAAHGPEAIAAHQFGELAAVVGGGAVQGPHFHQPHSNPGLGYLPGRLGASQAGSDHQQAGGRPVVATAVIEGGDVIDWGAVID
jgi:hypothetical protein